MKDSFSTYHPLVNFIYFLFVFLFSMFFMHPICLIISLICSFIYSINIKGKKAVKMNFLYLLPTILLTALINPAFNHEGATILTYFHTGNPLTLESLTYGLAASTMLVTVIVWFMCYNEIMSSDKFVYLFGRLIPSMSLLLSMALRFIPKFKAQIKIVVNAQRAIGKDVSNGSIISRAKNGLIILSIMITWALENSIDSSDSMRSRGYGLENRTAFSIYRFEKRDKLAITAILFMGIYIIIGAFTGNIKWRYFPTMKGIKIGIYQASIFILYFILLLIPVIINVKEDKQWKATQLKI